MGEAAPAAAVSAADAAARRMAEQLSAISYIKHGQCRFSSPSRTGHAGGMYDDEISAIAFAEPEMVRYLLALLPADAVAGLDPSRLRRLPAKQVGRGARRRVADMAWAVGAPTPERPDAEALLVIEFQSAPHPAWRCAWTCTWRCCARRWSPNCRPPPACRRRCRCWSTPATAHGGRPACGS